MTKSKKVKTDQISTPKGMRDFIGPAFYAYQGFFEKAAEVVHYYGFKPIQTPIVEKKDIFTSGVGENTDIVEKEMYSFRVKRSDALALRPEGTAPVVRAYVEHGMHALPQPVALYYYGPFFRHDKPQRGRYREFFQFGIEVLGSEKSITDAMVMQITKTILEEVGFKNLCVLINSIGDKECRPNFIRELAAYYRKHINNLCPNCRGRIRNNPLRLLDCKDKRCQEFKEEAPDMVSFLCESCKTHFKEVLEHLESLNVSYQIDHTLVRGLDYYTRTVFEIINDPEGEACEEEEGASAKKENKKTAEKEGAVSEQGAVLHSAEQEQEQKEEKERTPAPLSLGSGGRYDSLARLLGSKNDVPGMGMAIGVDRVLEAEQFNAWMPRIVKKPKIYFIQLGYGAKLKSLMVIEVLRKAKVPVLHSLNKDKLSSQLGAAEKTKIPYVLIIGQKEALEDSVIIRDMATRSQETVKIVQLADYLKKKL